MAQEKFYFDNPKSVLKKYPEGEILKIFEDYLDINFTVKVTTEKYEIEEPLRMSLPFMRTDEECRFCSLKLYNKPKRYRYGSKPYRYCPNCNHYEDKDICECQECRDEAEKERKEKYQAQVKLWDWIYKQAYSVVHEFDKLNINDIIDILVLFDKLYDNKRNELLFYYSNYERIGLLRRRQTESKQLGEIKEIASHLSRKKLLIPAISMKVIKNTDGDIVLPHIGQGGAWVLNIKDDDNEIISMNELHKKFNEIEFIYEDKLYLLKSLYLIEFKKKINHESKKFLKFKFEDLMIKYYVDILFPIYSLAEAFQIGYFVIKNALGFIASCNPSAPAVITYLKNEIKRVVNRLTDRRVNTRPIDWQVPLDLSTEYLLDEILNIRDSYFDLPIQKLLPPSDNNETQILDEFIFFKS